MKSNETINAVKKLKGLELLASPELKELVRFAQVIPETMMQELKCVAAQKGISIELEIASRLLVTFIEPEVSRMESLSQKILDWEFSPEDAVQECKLNHEHWLYPYELKKLELFLEFQSRLPRKFKEKFMLIDIKAESKRILGQIRKDKKSQAEE